LSESSWDHEAVNQRRIELLCADAATAPHAQGVLVIDDTGDRKDGTATAHVARQYCEDGGARRPRAWSDSRQYRLRASPVICRPGSEAVSRHHRVGVVSL
jgi:hypothetical protein